jgi:regulatory protein
MRLRQELQKKGIASEAITQAVAGLQDTELARARDVWGRRFDAIPLDAKERGKQMRFLMARGFAGGVVAKVLKGTVDE